MSKYEIITQSEKQPGKDPETFNDYLLAKARDETLADEARIVLAIASEDIQQPFEIGSN